MLRVVLPSLVGLVLIAVWVFALFDVIATDEQLVRNLPNKLVWLFIVAFLWIVGALAWFLLGRPVGAGLTPGSTASRPNRTWQQPQTRTRRPRGVEDRPDWNPGTTPSEPGPHEPGDAD